MECNQLPIVIGELVNHTHDWVEDKLRSIEMRVRETEWTFWHMEHDWAIHQIPYGMVYESTGHRDWINAGKPAGWKPAEIYTVEQQIEEVIVLKEGMLDHIDLLHGEVKRYQAHLARKHKASQGQMDLMSKVTDTQALPFIDYKQKVLPCETKEAQSKTFKKRGKSLFGMVAMFRVPGGYLQ